MKNKIIFLTLFVLLLGWLSAETNNIKEDVSVQAMNSYERQYSVLMNNIVNANSPGFKSSKVVVSQSEGKLGYEEMPVISRGSLVFTGDTYHAAIDGPGFYVVESPEGIYYTRDGRFRLNDEFQLVTLSQGFPVYGESGPIILSVDETGGVDFTITDEGLIVQKDSVVARLLVGEISDISKLEYVNGIFFKQKTAKKKEGSTEYKVDESIFMPMENFKIRQGYYEAANVDMAKELINLPLISKKYDANSKALQIKRKAKVSAREMGKAQ